MATTHKSRILIAEQSRLINECHQIGMTDAGWSREKDIAASTFLTESAATRKQQRIRSQHRIMVIVRARAQIRTHDKRMNE